MVSLEEDSVILQAESGSVMSPIDVEIEDTENSDTGTYTRWGKENF